MRKGQAMIPLRKEEKGERSFGAQQAVAGLWR